MHVEQHSGPKARDHFKEERRHIQIGEHSVRAVYKERDLQTRARREAIRPLSQAVNDGI